jgi:hypothetical protein
VSHELCPLGPAEELIDAESFHRLYTALLARKPRRHPARRSEPSALPATPRAARSVSAPHPAAAPAELELIQRLTRQDVERAAVRRARGHADSVAFFLARGGRIQATCCDPDPPRRPEPIHSIERRFPLASVLEQQQVYHGAPGGDPLTSRILRTLGREGVREIVLVPICVYGRTVAFLYADAGWKPFARASVAEFASIGSGIARIFERMIVERKRDDFLHAANGAASSPARRRPAPRPGPAAS